MKRCCAIAFFLCLAVSLPGRVHAAPCSGGPNWVSWGTLDKAVLLVNQAVCAYRLQVKPPSEPAVTYPPYLNFTAGITPVAKKFAESACAIGEVLPDGKPCTRINYSYFYLPLDFDTFGWLVAARLIPSDSMPVTKMPYSARFRLDLTLLTKISEAGRYYPANRLAVTITAPDNSTPKTVALNPAQFTLQELCLCSAASTTFPIVASAL